MMWNPVSILGDAVKTVGGIFQKREERKQAKESADAKLVQSKQDDTFKLEFTEQEIEVMRTQGLSGTWKDEYVTVSIISVFNLILAGGILQAFGIPEVLEGVGIALREMKDLGLDVGNLITIVAFAGVGLSVWRRM